MDGFTASMNVFATVGLGVVTCLATLAIYRLFLHPLSRIPGPRLAALTWAYEIYYDVVLPGQYIFKIMAMHKRYGPIIRINPEEIHIADKDFLGEIYDRRKRNRLYEPSLDTADSVAGTTDYELHRRRRQAMIGFFSPKAVKQLEPLLMRKRDCLLDAIDKVLGSDQALNISDLYFAYCWDLIQEYAFAFKSDVLANPEEANKLRNNSNDLLLQVNFTRFFSWVNALAGFLPAGIGEKMIPAGVIDLKRLAVRVRGNVDDVLRDEKTTKEDIESASQHRSIFYTLRDDHSLPVQERSPLRLQREGWFLVVAGSDTPGRVLARTHFHLLDSPQYMERLREELRPLGANPKLEDLEHLPFLNACVLEGNRLSFGLSRRNYRTAREDTLVYGKYAIPPGTSIAVSTLAVHGDESIFPDAFTFKPERWLQSDAKELRKYLMSFGAKGPRSCLGYYLAESELRLAIASVARYDMQLFKTTVRDVEYKHDFQMPHGDLQSKGVRAIVLANVLQK